MFLCVRVVLYEACVEGFYPLRLFERRLNMRNGNMFINLCKHNIFSWAWAMFLLPIEASIIVSIRNDLGPIYDCNVYLVFCACCVCVPLLHIN